MPKAEYLNDSSEPETYEPFETPDTFCEMLVRIERLGSCRRLVFAVSGRCASERVRNVVAKLVVPAEMMAEIAQRIGSDSPEPDTGFARVLLSAVPN
jgi:hypothetical protein